jgi:hypothetical protein
VIDDFNRDDREWQLPIALRLLDPVYRLRGWHVTRYDGRHEMQKLHVDVTLERDGVSINIDEKILRRRRDGRAPVAVSCETWTCSVPGHERRGWLWHEEKRKTDIILICYADALVADDVYHLDCLWIPCPALVTWFWEQGEDRWPENVSQQSNRSISRKVPIDAIKEAIPGFKRFHIYDGVIAPVDARADLGVNSKRPQGTSPGAA